MLNSTDEATKNPALERLFSANSIFHRFLKEGFMLGGEGGERERLIIAVLLFCMEVDGINCIGCDGVLHLQRPTVLSENERSLCQDYQTAFIYSTVACCLGDQCNPSVPPPSPFPSDWRLY